MTSTTTTGPFTTGPFTTSPVATEADGDVTQGHDDHSCAGCLDRRQLLTRAGGTGLVVAAAAVLAACGSSSSPGTGDTKGPAATPGADGATPLAQVADVPVGGALLVENGGEKILLVQATAGTVTAVSAICTHQGCTVQPAKDELDCPCHGSKFTLEGANISGPADKPLPAVDVHVKDGAVFSGAA